MSPESSQNNNISKQRKSTLKWNTDGELTSIDMTRIVTNLSKPELTKCDLPSEKEK
tara:strand:- start:499 stop:666 length:168 start_codon:yes stop_codon:yes gene_type:complete